MESMPTDFFTLNALNTVAGAAAAVYLIVRFSKPYIKNIWHDRAVRPYALVWSWLVLAFARASQEQLAGMEDLGLIFLNGFVVLFTSMGVHEAVRNPGAR